MTSLRRIRSHIVRRLAPFAHDDSGATAIEYGLVVALIALGIIAAVNTTGSNIKNTFSTVQGSLANTGK